MFEEEKEFDAGYLGLRLSNEYKSLIVLAFIGLSTIFFILYIFIETLLDFQEANFEIVFLALCLTPLALVFLLVPLRLKVVREDAAEMRNKT